MLIKKTVVLTSDVTVGYITLVRVGNSVGMKVMLNSDPQGKLYLGLRAGSKPQINSEITDRRTEMNVNLDLGAMDELGAVLIDGSGSVYATGGKKEAVNTDKILKVRDAEKEDPYAATSADAASDTEREKETATDGSAAVSNEITEKSVGAPDESFAHDSEEQDNETADTDTLNKDTRQKESVQNVAAEEETGAAVREAFAAGGAFPPFSANKGENFYRNIRGRLEEIMTANPREEDLERLIPESKWVKVFYDEEDYYVVGILSEAGEVTFLAYGVPGIEGIKPPKEAEELCDFLAIPGTVGEGYWLMFQNAKNGDILKSL